MIVEAGAIEGKARVIDLRQPRGEKKRRKKKEGTKGFLAQTLFSL